MTETQRCHGCGRKLFAVDSVNVRKDGHGSNCPVERQARALEKIEEHMNFILEEVTK